jgi:tRNA-specific 2-thiouridylase
MKRRSIILLSGGLDSILAARLMLEQGVEVLAVNFSAKLCMCGCKRTGESQAEAAAKMLNIPLETIDITADFIEIIKNPRYGHGANMNPCIDCKIYMLKHAKDMMQARGEVLGERPMSQRMDAMNLIEKRAGVKGILLRPLTAKNLAPTNPELEGIVDREKLLDIRGRSRKPQIALAEKFGIAKYPNPAGGCLLTDPGFAKRVKDAISHGEFDAANLAILSVGRHFRLDKDARLVVGRDEKENEVLEPLAGPEDILLALKDHEGPLALLRGKANAGLIKLAASIMAYHTKFKDEDALRVDYWRGSPASRETISVKAAIREDVEKFRI